MCLRDLIRNWILLVMQVKTNGKKTACWFDWDQFLIQFTVLLHKYLCMGEAQREDRETRSEGGGVGSTLVVVVTVCWLNVFVEL